MTSKSNQQQNTSFNISEKSEKSKMKNKKSYSENTSKTEVKDSAKANNTTKNANPLNDNLGQKIQIPNFVALESTLGAVSLLATKSQNHKYLFVSDLEWLVMPAIALKQFALFRSAKNEPIAFVNWAFINDEVEQRILNHTTKLKPQDWKSGNKAYIIDIISPLNIGAEILNQLNEKQFKDKEIKLIRPKKDGKGFEAKLLSEIVKEFSKNSESETTKQKVN